MPASAWLGAFRYIDECEGPMIFNHNAVHQLWTVNGGRLRDKVKDDGLILRVLKRALPAYRGDGMVLYRGECAFLYEQQLIGFCWTPLIEVATMFAEGLNAMESGGVLLRADARADAILTGPNQRSHYLGESEYTCDPTKLTDIAVVRRFQRS